MDVAQGLVGGECSWAFVDGLEWVAQPRLGRAKRGSHVVIQEI